MANLGQDLMKVHWSGRARKSQMQKPYMPARSWEIDDLAKSFETLKVGVQQLYRLHHLLHSTALPQLPPQHCAQLTRISHISCTTRHLKNINSGILAKELINYLYLQIQLSKAREYTSGTGNSPILNTNSEKCNSKKL